MLTSCGVSVGGSVRRERNYLEYVCGKGIPTRVGEIQFLISQAVSEFSENKIATQVANLNYLEFINCHHSGKRC